jgi:hypothetical protein
MKLATQLGETGRIELMVFVGFTGKSVADFAAPPNFGIMAVRDPDGSLNEFYQTIETPAR